MLQLYLEHVRVKLDQEVMQQVQWELFYFEFTKTEDFDRTKRGYPVLVQYCDVKEDFKSNRKRSKTDQGSSLGFQKFQSLEVPSWNSSERLLKNTPKNHISCEVHDRFHECLDKWFH